MAIQRVELATEFEAFLAERTQAGRYANVAEAYEAAKGALLREEAESELNVAFVKQAIAEAEASGEYEGDVFADIRAELGLPARAHA